MTVDTEFLRERTYYAKLCLIQMAMPGTDDDTARLSIRWPKAGLTPFYDLLANPAVTKVFHAARQDIEIFAVDRGVIRRPV